LMMTPERDRIIIVTTVKHVYTMRYGRKEGRLTLSNERAVQSIYLSISLLVSKPKKKKKKTEQNVPNPTPCSTSIKETIDVAPHHAMGWALAM
jgi:hypothetical protein